MTWVSFHKLRLRADVQRIIVLFVIGMCLSGEAQGAQDFVVLGHEGVWIRQGSTIISGDIGANQSSAGPYLNGEQEVTIGHDVLSQNTDSQIMGNTIRLKKGSQVQNIFANTLLGRGQVFGAITTPVILPLISGMPPVPLVHPGFQDIDIPANEMLTLSAGAYGLLKARPGATVILTGGLHHFREWDIRKNAQVLAEDAVEIRVEGTIDARRHTTIGPVPSAGTLTAADIVIIGTGLNGTTGIRHAGSGELWGREPNTGEHLYSPGSFAYQSQ